ncbi:MAG: phosphatidylserine decarboxylase [Elusimicrobia bacterium]|nr:phosphatidylserine decarboxylase [Elusimicrobiota bacterium]MCR4663022.1 phosphatidylserine decarboxylase [Endomicrobiaceae bacterium]
MKIVKEGFPFIFGCFIVGLICNLFFAPLAIIFYLLAIGCLLFFRDPDLTINEDKNFVLSPCNGTVMNVIENENGQTEVRVFMSVANVHLQRSPVSGTVKSVEHKPGKFLKAHLPEAYVENEQNVITIENENGTYIVKQIAGILARRCVAWVKPGDVIKQGDKIGVIKFSSQVDLIMPAGYDVRVKVGDKVTSGLSIFAVIK